MSLEYKPSLGFVETAGLVIAIQVADAMAKAAEVEIKIGRASCRERVSSPV